jgi:hypothetical protein
MNRNLLWNGDRRRGVEFAVPSLDELPRLLPSRWRDREGPRLDAS